MLKRYLFNGVEYQFEEGKQPKDAVEIKTKAVEPPNKAVKAENKTRKAVKKK